MGWLIIFIIFSCIINIDKVGNCSQCSLAGKIDDMMETANKMELILKRSGILINISPNSGIYTIKVNFALLKKRLQAFHYCVVVTCIITSNPANLFQEIEL